MVVETPLSVNPLIYPLTEKPKSAERFGKRPALSPIPSFY